MHQQKAQLWCMIYDAARLAATETGVPQTAKFNKENQDRMADYYLNIAGYQEFINGRITARTIQQ